ncbi:MAG: helix-turn-helix transcriptional regulator [Clostridiaceae bacterium]|nr:helix-turn-helix transcriptional regulator [Clostridiaceae bacterium]
MSEYTVFHMIADMIEKATGVTVSFLSNTKRELSRYDPFLSYGLSHLEFDNFQEEKMYCLEDSLHVHTIIIRRRLPDDILMIAGPFLTEELTSDRIIQVIGANGMHPSVKSALQDYYRSLPLAPITQVRYYAGSAGRYLYGKAIKFDIVMLSLDKADTTSLHSDPKEQLMTFRQIEKCYDLEKKMLWEVEHGNRKEALETYEALYLSMRKQLTGKKLLQSSRCYSHTLNALIRKAAQQSGVHVSLLHSVFQKHMDRIEQSMTAKGLHEGNIIMLGDYITLVQKLSMESYSKSIRQAAAFILTNLSTELNLSDLADLSNLSPTYLASLFKKETGSTVVQFITKKRMQLASNLLINSGLQIQEIALYLGYQDTSYFSRVFRKEMGMPPQEYRKTQKILHINSRYSSS